MSTRDAAIALRRLGLGARPGDLRRIAADPGGSCSASWPSQGLPCSNDPDLEPSHVVFAEAQRAQLAQRDAKQAAKEAAKVVRAPDRMDPAASMPDAATPPAGLQLPPAKPSPNGVAALPLSPSPPLAPSPAAPGARPNAIRRDALVDEISSRIDRAITTETPFLERLVLFWSNHFCVSATKGPVRGIAGGYEREAIRPHVLGRFADMLKASAQHPAMLIYLDNQISIGPNSQAGKNRKRGLNENLAREILELHTLGVDGGYTPGRRDELRAHPDWLDGRQPQSPADRGREVLLCASTATSPAPGRVLGKRYEDQGQRSGEAVLADLARHPATARHIARKLARHFVADDAAAGPGRSARSRRSAKADGDLAAVTPRADRVARGLGAAADARSCRRYDFVISIVRGFGIRPKSAEIGAPRRGARPADLGRRRRRRAGPTTTMPGWGPPPIRERLRIAEIAGAPDRQADRPARTRRGAARRRHERGDTDQAIARAETREQGFELLVMAPEFLRR